MVEFALLLPILVILLFGIIEFGLLLYNKAIITNASREGARAGIVYREPLRVSAAEIEDTARNYCEDFVISFGSVTPPLVTTQPADPTVLNSGNPLTVTVTYRYQFLLLPNFVTLADGIDLVGTTTMMEE